METDDLEEQGLKPRGLVGLTNIGNSCYMNSALQSLSNCPPLTNYFLKCDDFEWLSTSNGKVSVSKCFKELITEMWDKKRPKSLTPQSLMKAIRYYNPTFRGYAQQDTQEFLRCIMDRLHEEMKYEANDYSELKFVGFGENEDEDGTPLIKNKKLLGGNGSSDDSTVEMEVDNKQSGNLFKNRNKQSITCLLHKSPDDKDNRGHAKSTSDSKQSKKDVKYRSIITNVFDGKLLSSVQCLTCNRISNTVETFQDLSLPIPTKDDLNHMHSQAVISCSPNMNYDTGWFLYLWSWVKSMIVGPEIKLQDCLAAFFTNDELKGDNMYNCEKCKKLRNGIKYSRVHSLPETLCIHLKRFRHELYHSSKINTYISFPLYDLDLQPFLSKDCSKSPTSSKYDLTAIICHFGSVGGGHYIAYARNCITNKWYEFNDSYVTEVSETTVGNAEAYVLFYSLKDEGSDLFRNEINHRLKNSNESLCDHYISKEWLNRFNSCVKPGPVSNFDLTCQHGGINLRSYNHIQKSVTSVPKSVAKNLFQRFGGGPELTCLQLCQICKEIEDRKTYELETFVKLQKDDSSTTVYHISMKWYNSWYSYVARKSEENPGAIDNSDLINNRPSCDKDDDLYGVLTESTWRFLHSQYGGGPVVAFLNNPSETSQSEDDDDDDDMS